MVILTVKGSLQVTPTPFLSEPYSFYNADQRGGSFFFVRVCGCGGGESSSFYNSHFSSPISHRPVLIFHFYQLVNRYSSEFIKIVFA